jgi:uncharacterized protein (TIGR02466 family)
MLGGRLSSVPRYGAVAMTGQNPTLPFEVRGLFPTLLVVSKLADMEQVNQDVAARILQRETQSQGDTYSNVGGWQSTKDLLQWGGPGVQRIVDAARSIAAEITGDSRGEKRNVNWRVNVWANVNREGNYNEIHYHPAAYWSGVYYVQDGNVAKEGSLDGCLVFHDPRGAAPAMYAPNVKYTIPGMQSGGGHEFIWPKSGTLLLFPSWLAHSVRSFGTKATRISIAFNFFV